MKRTTTIKTDKQTTRRLRPIAAALGYVLSAGAMAGEGDVSALIEAVARGELEIRPVARPEAPEGAAEQLKKTPIHGA